MDLGENEQDGKLRLKVFMETQRPMPDLSPREQQLLQFAAEGLTDTAIANRLGISEATVGTYWGRVRIKLGPYSRTELVAIVMRAEREAALDSLRQENDELVKRLHERMLEGEVSFYRDLLDAAPDAMILVSEGGIVEYGNVAASEIFGYAQDEMVGIDLTELVPPRLRDKHRVHREEYVSSPQRRAMGEHLETPAVRKDGTEFMIRAALSSVTTPTGLVITCAIRLADA